MLERRLVSAVGLLHLVSGRVTQLALRGLDVVPRVADLAPDEVDRAAVLVDQDATVVLLVDTAVVEGVLLVVVRGAQVFLLLVVEGLPFGQDRSLNRVLRAVLAGNLRRVGRRRGARCRFRGSRRRGRRTVPTNSWNCSSCPSPGNLLRLTRTPQWRQRTTLFFLLSRALFPLEYLPNRTGPVPVDGPKIRL